MFTLKKHLIKLIEKNISFKNYTLETYNFVNFLLTKKQNTKPKNSHIVLSILFK